MAKIIGPILEIHFNYQIPKKKMKIESKTKEEPEAEGKFEFFVNSGGD